MMPFDAMQFMMAAFSDCSSELVDRWEKLIIGSKGGSSIEVDVRPELQNFSRDVISRTAFGSSYEEGTRVFEFQTQQAELLLHASLTAFIQGFRFLPTSTNNRMKAIQKEVHGILKKMIERRKTAILQGEGKHSSNLLDLLIESNLRHAEELGVRNLMTTEDIVEECKLFYIAGQETTASLLTWTLILLGKYPTWQTRAREEVLHVLGNNKTDMDCLNRMKIVSPSLSLSISFFTARQKKRTRLELIDRFKTLLQHSLIYNVFFRR